MAVRGLLISVFGSVRCTVNRCLAAHVVADTDNERRHVMEELCTWYEVIRSLLPQRYEMSLETRPEAIVVVSSATGTVVRVTESELCGRTPTQVVRGLRERLRTGRQLSFEAMAV
jgi:hypothetical protein